MSEWERLHRLGYQHALLGEWAKARHCYESTLAQQPDYPQAQLALSQLTMMESRFHQGREQYEARFSAGDAFSWRHLPIPQWRGENLRGKHLHLWVEQGFGDVIMYGAFLPYLLAQKPARLTISMFPKMMSLFVRSFPDITVESLDDIGSHLASAAILETFPQIAQMAEQAGLALDLEPMRMDYERARLRGIADYAAPMGDLLVYCLPDIIPAARQASHLMADSARIREAKQKLEALGPGRRIGISWYSSNAQSGYARNLPLSEWLPILKLPNCHFIALQHHVAPAETERFNAENHCRIIVDPAFDPVQDTEGLAALTACMDEVISIDNSNAHLAGALGVPTMLLLPKGHDFRWPPLQGEHDTLWYRHVRTERQEQAMDWRPVIERVVNGLCGRV